MSESTTETYDARRERLVRELRVARAGGARVGLAKSTSNLFRQREQNQKHRIDVREFHRVLRVDPVVQVADVEGMTTYEELVDETWKCGLLPTVV